MNRPAAVGLVVLLLAVSGLGTPVTAGATPDPPADATHSTQSIDAAPTAAVADGNVSDPETTTFDVTVHENGSITWTFRQEHPLRNSEVENFDEYATEFEAGETRLYDRFINQSESLTETGAEQTGREMEATNFRPSANVQHRPGPIGVVELSFTWHGFGVVEDGTVTIGDVFRDMYLADYHTLVVQPDDGLVLAEATPTGEHDGDTLEDAEAVSWEGERRFADGYPEVVFTQPGTTPAGGDDGDLRSWIGEFAESSLAPLAALVVVLGLALGGALAWYRRSRSDDAAASGERTNADDGGDPEATPLADEELLTDEDRVVRLIRENGGRMKQVNIVEETGWSKSKVSMLLSDMEDEGTISKLRVGRENIISLEGFEPEATKSPFEN